MSVVHSLADPQLLKLKVSPGVDECWALGPYSTYAGQTELAKLFTQGKYQHPAVGAKLGRILASSVVNCAPANSLLRCPDQVVAMPSSHQLARRLAVELAKALGRPEVVADSLSWNRPTASMKNIPVGERASYIKGAMRATSINGGTVILVDDLVQSLATFTEGARAVRAAGAQRVACVALVALDP